MHPVRETGAKSGQPATWGTFDEAAAFYERHAGKPDRGAGFEFAAEDGLVGIDLDLALDPAGEPYPWAADLLRPFEDLGGTYVEVSPSGRGLHLITRAQLPRNPNRIEYGGVVEVIEGKKKESGVEVYRERRYFTVTGDVWRGLGDVGDGQALVQGLLDATGLTARMAARSVEGPAHQDGLEAGREDEVRSALAALDPDMSHPDWIAVGMALRVAFGSAGFQMWDDWSSLGAKYDGPHDLLWRWRSFNGSGIGLGTLLDMAKKRGWSRPPVDAAREFREFVEVDHSDILGTAELEVIPRERDVVPYHVTKKGIAKTAGNIALFLAQDPKWAGRLRWNVRRGAELDGAMLEDAGYTMLGTMAERALGFDGAAAVDHVYRGVEVAARRSEYDPVREFILSKPWDGVGRIDDWLVRVGAEDTEVNRLISRRFMIGAAGRVLCEAQPNRAALPPHEGVKFDYVVILEGPQGIQKSSLCAALSPPGYFFGSHMSLSTSSGVKDAYDAISRHFVVEMAELDAMSRAETTTVNAVISSPYDDFRPAYGRTTIRRARLSVILGTTNKHEWNRDMTGARRWWPVSFWHRRETELLDVDWVRDNLQQLYAEGAERYRRGEVFWEDARLKALLKPLHADRLSRADWMDSAEEFVCSPEVLAHGWFTTHLLRQSDPFIKRVTGQQLNEYLRLAGCHDLSVKVGGRTLRVWAAPGTDYSHDAVRARIEAHPYAAIDAEFKVLP